MTERLRHIELHIVTLP